MSEETSVDYFVSGTHFETSVPEQFKRIAPVNGLIKVVGNSVSLILISLRPLTQGRRREGDRREDSGRKDEKLITPRRPNLQEAKFRRRLRHHPRPN